MASISLSDTCSTGRCIWLLVISLRRGSLGSYVATRGTLFALFFWLGCMQTLWELQLPCLSGFEHQQGRILVWLDVVSALRFAV